MSNELRFIEDVLYKLKQGFGLPVNILWTVSSTPNVETGNITTVRDSVCVNRCIVLPNKIDRDFVYNLPVIASNKNFTYGGFYDQHRRRFIVDRKDLPSDFEIRVGYTLIFNGKRFEVEQVEEFEYNAGYLLVAKQEINVELANVIKRHHYSALFLQDTVEVEVA